MADPLTADQVPAVIARLARLEQEKRTGAASTATHAVEFHQHGWSEGVVQSTAQNAGRHALDAAALALAQQALAAYVSREDRARALLLAVYHDAIGEAHRLLKLEDTDAE